MTNRDSIDLVLVREISPSEAAQIVGGAGLDITAIKQQAQAYCPATVAKYASVTPANVTRASAQGMANSCLAEMGPFKAMFARGPIQQGIDQAFPAKK